MHKIHFGLEGLSEYLERIKPGKIFVLADINTQKYCYPSLLPVLPEHHSIIVSDGETNKNLTGCESIWRALTELNADRQSLLINVGGGVVTDMGGFAASVYKRGIRFVNIPTTLLAMVDASVGAKTGIDFLGFKNQIGSFKEPEAIFIHLPFLATLSDREYKAGLAEVIKHLLISDRNALDLIPELPVKYTYESCKTMVEQSIRFKQSIVEKDPHETGIRKALNFGHTIGHALESLGLSSRSTAILHGEAVAAGMVMESYLSMRKNLISEDELQKISDYIFSFYDLPKLPEEMIPTTLDFMKQDKKNEFDTIRFTLLNGVGSYLINQIAEENIIIDSFRYYNEKIG